MTGPATRIMALMAAVLLVLEIVTRLYLWGIAVRGVVQVVPWCLMYVTCRRSAATRQPWGWPVLLWTIDYPLTSFFCVVKRRLTKSAQAFMVRFAEAESVLKGCWPMTNWRSQRRKVKWPVSAPPPQYSTGMRRKNNLIRARSLMACWCSVPP